MMKLLLLNLQVLVTTVISLASGQSCFDNEEKCVEDLRLLLVDTNAFWFGDKYTQVCPQGPSDFDASCSNPDPTLHNILFRLYGTGNFNTTEGAAVEQAVNAMSLADVRFSSSGHSGVFACGHTYNAEPINESRLDPLAVTKLNIWSMKHANIKMAWPSQPGKQYMVIVWDVGSYFLHGLYINCINGDINTCLPVKKYSGPLNPRPTPNTYLFIVLEQDNTLNFNAVMGAMYAVQGANNFKFKYNQFSQQTPTGKLVAANVMNIVGDIYGAERIGKVGAQTYNYCPLHVSMHGDLEKALGNANITADWSTDTQVMRPFLTSLEIEMEAVYTVPELKFESCCKQYTFIGANTIVDPLSTSPKSPVHVRTKPRIELSPMNVANWMGLFSQKVYILMMVDFGNVGGTPRTDAVYSVHWLISDIKDGDVSTGVDIIPYVGPNPFSRTGPNMYTFLLFEQPMRTFDSANLTNYISGTCDNYQTDRCQYRVKDMIEGFGLGDIKAVTWFKAQQDEFARMRMYDTWRAREKTAVCDGIPGYSDPCPLTCNDVRDHASTSQQNLFFVCLVVLFTIWHRIITKS